MTAILERLAERGQWPQRYTDMRRDAARLELARAAGVTPEVTRWALDLKADAAALAAEIAGAVR